MIKIYVQFVEIRVEKIFAERLQKWVKLIIYVNFIIKIYVQFVEILWQAKRQSRARVKNIFAE